MELSSGNRPPAIEQNSTKHTRGTRNVFLSNNVPSRRINSFQKTSFSLLIVL